MRGRPPGRERGLAARDAAIRELADMLAPGGTERERAALTAKWLSLDASDGDGAIGIFGVGGRREEIGDRAALAVDLQIEPG